MDKAIARQPLISIIMPAYNAGRFIDDAIRSVKAQHYNHWELIVIDDGSVDGTAAIVKQHRQADGRVVYHYQSNAGLGGARNTGLKLASGEWIGFLDADDLWTADKLQQQVDVMEATGADVIFSEGYYLHESGEMKPYSSLHGIYEGGAMYRSLMVHNSIAVLSVLIRKAIVSQIGLQETHGLARGCEDWDYWLRACRANALFYGIAKPLFMYRLHAAAMSNDHVRMRIAGAYVLAKNFNAKQLPEGPRRKIKKTLLSAAKLMIGHIRGKNIPYSASCVKLLLKIFSISGGAIPAMMKRRHATIR